jgi:class 3 adenylate cyclase/TolB-like protein/predicted Zn-dependent protease
MTEPIDDDTAWPQLQRERRAIVVVDVVESVRLMQADEAGVIDRWRRFVNLVRTQVLPVHGGRMVKSLGDGLLLEFATVPSAVQAAIDIQAAIGRPIGDRPEAERMQLRIGVHFAEVTSDEHDIYGTGVNLAARLTTLAGPGEIVASAQTRDALADGLDASVEDLGDCYMKHIDAPVRAFRVGPPGRLPVIAPAAPEPGPTRPTVAVIPLRMLGPQAEHQLIGDALADEIIAALSKTQALNVTSRMSTTVFKGRPDTPAQIAMHLGANYLISGSVQVSGQQLKVMIELVEAPGGRIVWADRLLGDLRAVWAAEDSMIATIVSEVGAAVMQHELQRASSHALPTVKSYSLLLGAIALMHRSSPAEFDTSKAMLDHLIDRDRRHARPYAWLANWHALRVTQSRSDTPQVDIQLAFEHAQRALDRDPQCALALAIDGVLQLNLRKDIATARQRLDAALESNPNESLAWLFRGILHGFAAEGVPAEQASARALMLSPVDPMRHYYDSLASTAALGAGHYARAIELAERSLRVNRMHPSTYRSLAIAQSMSGLHDKARASVAELLKLTPSYTVSQFRAVSGFAMGPLGDVFTQAFRSAGLPE